MAQIRVKTELVDGVLYGENETDDQSSTVNLGSQEENDYSLSSEKKRQKFLKQQMKAVSPRKAVVLKNFPLEQIEMLLRHSIELKQKTNNSKLTACTLQENEKEKPSSSTRSSNHFLKDSEIEALIENSTVTFDEEQLMQLGLEEIHTSPPEQDISAPNIKPSVEELLYFLCKKVLVIEKQLIQLTGEKPGPQLKFKLPCKTWKHVFIADKILSEDKAQFALLVKQLASFSSDLPSCNYNMKMVNSMLRNLMLDSAATHFCLTGSEHKYEFQSTLLHQAVIAAIQQKKNCENIGTELIAKAIAQWLSQAKKRMTNRSESGTNTTKEKKLKKMIPENVDDMVTSQSEESD